MVLTQKLVARGVSEAEMQQVRDEVEAEVKAAVEFAEKSPWPDLSEAYTDVFAP